VNRRAFVKAMMMGGIYSSLALKAPLALSQSSSKKGYKALVCLMLKGGFDGHDLIIPTGQSAYNNYRSLRPELLDEYGDKRARSSLLTPDSTSFDGVALPPELAKVHSLINRKQATVVANVGPLIKPTTRTNFKKNKQQLPKRLFSHNDQIATWLSGQPEGAGYGWGGFFIDAMLANNAESSPEFSAITTSGEEVFLSGATSRAYRVKNGSAPRSSFFKGYKNNRKLRQELRQFAGMEDVSGDLEATTGWAQAQATQMNTAFRQALSKAPKTNLITDKETALSKQLFSVLKTINARRSLNTQQQIFIVSVPGFDTHSGQAERLSDRWQMIDDAISDFYTDLSMLGLSDDVTLFTASEFGRTLTSNGDGTDHGWGNHHLMIGGAAKGRDLIGEIPPSELGHRQDAGRGRLIPTTSVEQYASILGRWWGLSDRDLSRIWSELG